MQSLLASIRIAAVTMLVCLAGYASLVWAIGQAVSRDTANGALITGDDGTIIGSRQIAQAFTRSEYFWPRPSAVDYNAAGAGGSNLSPTSTAIAERGQEIAALYGATPDRPLPADLAAASGAGLDPHISEAGAYFQVARVAEARGLDAAQVETLVRSAAFAPGGILTAERIVNVLELNLALDRLQG